MMSFSGKTAITTFKLIQIAKVGGVSENSGYLLPDGHWDFQNWRRNYWENEASKMGRIHFLQYGLLWCPSEFSWLAIKANIPSDHHFFTHPVHIYNIYSDIYTAGPPDLDDVGYRTVLAFSNPGYSQRVAHIRSVEWDNEGQCKQ